MFFICCVVLPNFPFYQQWTHPHFWRSYNICQCTVSEHFNGPCHSLHDMQIINVENILTSGQKILEKRESYWFNKLCKCNILMELYIFNTPNDAIVIITKKVYTLCPSCHSVYSWNLSWYWVNLLEFWRLVKSRGKKNVTQAWIWQKRDFTILSQSPSNFFGNCYSIICLIMIV